MPGIFDAWLFKNGEVGDFPGGNPVEPCGPVVENPLTSGEDKGLIPDPGRSHMQQGN